MNHVLMIFLLVTIFVLGTIVGSLLNVCIYRLPLEKSIFWPGSRCGSCLQPIRWYDNIPLISYLVLRGRCRSCGARFSIRYLVVELLTGLCLVGLFYLEVIANVHHISILNGERQRIEFFLWPSWQAWVIFDIHAILLCFLLIVTFCDLDHREIPLSLTTVGAVIGVLAAVAFPWPWPNDVAAAALPPGRGWQMPPAPGNMGPAPGLYPWPVWGPPPAWLPPGSWRLGLATGITGLLVGTLLLRLIRFLFSTGLGVEALGLGDADLMMMAGAFLGWQPLVVAFFLSVIPGLLFAVAYLVFRWLTAWSAFPVEVRVLRKNGELALEVEGQTLTMVQLGTRLAEIAKGKRKTELQLDAMTLDQFIDDAIAAARDSAKQAGAAKIRIPARSMPPGFLMRGSQALLRFLGKTDKAQVKVELLHEEGRAHFVADGRSIPPEQLSSAIAAIARDRPFQVVLDPTGLDEWATKIAATIRITARGAGIERLYARDNAIPFGPSLAVGVMLSLLGWYWIGPRVQPLFFNGTLMLVTGTLCAVLMLAASYFIRLLRLMRHG